MTTELNVALIQTNLVWENPEQNRIHFSNKMAEINRDVDLIILPEMFSTGFTMKPQNIDDSEGTKTIIWLADEAKKNNVAIVGSIVYHEMGSYYNRLLFVNSEGDMVHYNKRHTFTLAGEHKIYTAGKERLIVNYKGFKICPLICYDLRFPVWSRNNEEYDVLLYVANWPKQRIDAWDTLLKARAIENMAYCIGVNRVGSDPNGYAYSGHSAVYDALGQSMSFSESDTVVYTTLNRDHLIATRKSLKFLEDKDDFTLQP